MSVRSGLSGGAYLWCDFDGVCFFHQITSLSLDPAQKICLGVSKILVKFTCFLVNNLGGKKRVSNDEFLLTKRILLSFPQFLSVFAVILHEVEQCTPNFFHQFDQHPQTLRKNTFFASKWIKKKSDKKKDSVRREKSIFSKHLWMLVNLVEKIWCTLLNFM